MRNGETLLFKSFPCIITYHRREHVTEKGSENSLVWSFIEKLRRPSGIEQVKWQTPDRVVWNCPMEGPDHHGAWLPICSCM